jgi:glycosyltransferase involved in cell wall biosynthesis
LRIAGDGPKRRRVDAAISRLGLSDDVAILGGLKRDDLLAHYAQADFFVLPSIRESFGIAALEARCAGLPIVAMRAAGCGEFLRHDENALLAGDDAELSHHMARLATDDDLRRRLAEAKIDFARFEWPRVVDTHLDHYARAAKIARERNRNFQPGG